jgi:hypothetical protein
MADDARFLRAQVARIRRLLLTTVNDAQTERALKQLPRNTRLARPGGAAGAKKLPNQPKGSITRA